MSALRPPRVLGAASLAVLAVAVTWHCLPFPWPTNRFDAGIALCAADLIADGRSPYTDFQTLYTPGGYYLKRWAFAAFGRTFDVHSYLDFTVMGVQAWMAWHCAARLGGSAVRALLALAAGLAFSYPYPSVALALLAVTCAVRPPDWPPIVRAVAAGGVAGLAGWFRQDFGAVAAVSAAVAVALSADGASRSSRFRAFAACGASAAGVLGLLLLPALIESPRRVWEGLVVNPMSTVAHRDTGHGSIGVLLDSVPLLSVALLGVAALVVCLSAGWAARRRAAPGIFPPGGSAAGLAGLAVMVLWSLRYLVLRTEPHHAVPIALVAAVAASAAFARSRAATFALTAVATAAIAVSGIPSAAARAKHMLGRREVPIERLGPDWPGTSTLWLPKQEADDYRRMLGFLRASDGGPILSACARHDRIHDQDLLLYFLLGRVPPAYDYHFDPGVTTRRDVQEGIVADAERAGVGTVVLFDSRDAAPPEATPMPLDRWLSQGWRTAGRYGRYEVRVR
ncbi:MAG: hypothetical protein HMLKMBBP_03549 [Planctomycetes bacterium]|nr:hypothetical protein [Planctomycetota bacterium]